MSEGEFYSGGAERHYREGGSLQENSVQFPAKSFEKKLEELRAGDAAEIARKYKFGRVVEELLKTHSIKDLTPTVCEEFLFSNPEFSEYHPALVRAVAEEIEIERMAQKDRTIH